MTKITAAALLIVSLAISIAGCGAFPGNTAGDLQGTSWVLESYAGHALISETSMTAVFLDGEVSGTASCNHYFASYKVKGNQVQISGLAWTEMACLDPQGIMTQEQEIMQLLGSAVSYQIEGNQLTIVGGSGEQLVFRAQQPE